MGADSRKGEVQVCLDLDRPSHGAQSSHSELQNLHQPAAASCGFEQRQYIRHAEQFQNLLARIHHFQLAPRVRAETCSVTTAPSPELSIIGTSFRSNTIRTFLSQASRIASFNSGTFSLVSRPKHSTTAQSADSLRSTRNPFPELTGLLPAILTLHGFHFLPYVQCLVSHCDVFAQSLPAWSDQIMDWKME